MTETPVTETPDVAIPIGYTVSLTYSSDETIVFIEIRDSEMGEYVADAILDRKRDRFVLGEDLATSPALPEWVGPFLDQLGAPKQQPAIAAIIDGEPVPEP